MTQNPGFAGSLGATLIQSTMTTRQVAHVLGVSERSVRRAIASGTLPAERSGAVYRISPLDVQQWAARRASVEQRPTVAPVAADSANGRLQTPGSPFVGRVQELDQMVALLANPAERLVTLTGPGGIGKTRLSLEVARSLQPTVQDGVCFVPLESVRDPALVPVTIAQGLGLEEQPGELLTSLLARALRSRRMLLILDNFEQVLPAAMDIAQILAGAPGVQILVTSRAPLRIVGERVVPLLPMLLPEGAVTPETLLASDASRLFIERAQRQAALPTLDAGSAHVIAQICARVDALPLGIELAAAATRLFTLEQLLERLARRLPLLEDGPRDAPVRHVAMRNAIAWSYDLLDPAEQSLFCRLSVFVGGFTLDAVEALQRGITPANELPPATKLLGTLLDHNLIRRVDGQGGTARYAMLETIREFGQEQLAVTGSEARARADHARYFREALQPILPVCSVYGVRAPLEFLAAEQGNLREALTWLQSYGDPTEFVELVAALGLAWYPYHANREGQRWLQAALADTGEITPLQRARLLIGYGGVCFAHGNHAEIVALLDDADALLSDGHAPLESALISTLRGASENRNGNYAAAERHLEHALEIASEIADPVLRSGMIGRIHANRSVSARGEEKLEAALQRMDAALHHYAVAGFDLAQSLVLATRGAFLHATGDVPGALDIWHYALVTMGALGEPRIVADTFTLAAAASVDAGEYESALLLFGAAEGMRERESTAWSWGDQAREVNLIERARGILGPERASQLHAAGYTYSPADAIALIGSLAERTRRKARPLTRRQLDVLRLLGNGKTDQEIADALFLSRRTVSWHVRAILAHFGASTREDAITRARSDGMLAA